MLSLRPPLPHPAPDHVEAVPPCWLIVRGRRPKLAERPDKRAAAAAAMRAARVRPTRHAPHRDARHRETRAKRRRRRPLGRAVRPDADLAQLVERFRDEGALPFRRAAAFQLLQLLLDACVPSRVDVLLPSVLAKVPVRLARSTVQARMGMHRVPATPDRHTSGLEESPPSPLLPTVEQVQHLEVLRAGLPQVLHRRGRHAVVSVQHVRRNHGESVLSQPLGGRGRVLASLERQPKREDG